MSLAQNTRELQQINKSPKETTLDFPQYRGLTFQEFWEALPHKLEYFDYEEELEQDLKETKHLWVKKSSGLGITEFTTRWIAWNCVKDDVWKNQQIDINVAIVVGPRLDLAITIMGRIRRLFGEEHFKSKETVIILNGNRIEAFPSHHLASMHGINPLVVFLDEGDLFPPGQQVRARQASERLIPKTNPYIIWVSTPYLPGGLYEQIEKEENCMYRRKIMLEDRGIGKVYSEEDIAIAKLSPTYEMEFHGKYGFGIGNVMSGIDDILEKYDTNLLMGKKAICADPAFGSSNFGICAGEQLDNILYIKEAKQYARPSPEAMLHVTEELAKQYDRNCHIDGAHPGLIRDLNIRGINAKPVNFGMPVRDTEGTSVQSLRSKMTINAAQMVKTKKVRIHPMFTDLISQLRSAQFDEKGGVDKKELTFDIGDAFIMLCWQFNEVQPMMRKFNWK